MNHIYTVPYTVQSALSTSSHWIFEDSRIWVLFPSPHRTAQRDDRTYSESITCIWRRWTDGSWTQVFAFHNPKLFSWYQEPPSVGKESDTLPGSSLAYDHHVILMYIFSDAIFHSCLRCPYSFLSYMVSMCHINYMVLKYSVLKKKTKKQKLNCGMIRCQGLLPWHTYIHVFCCVAGFVV